MTPSLCNVGEMSSSDAVAPSPPNPRNASKKGNLQATIHSPTIAIPFFRFFLTFLAAISWLFSFIGLVVNHRCFIDHTT